MHTKLVFARRPRLTGWRHWIIRFAVCLLLWSQASLLARVNVVTLPERNSVQLTIYNSVDLTLVRETRHLTFRKGLNRLEFSWANTLIDPTSVEFRALSHADEVEVLDVSFPPRVTNTLEWRINSEFAGEVQVEIRYFTSGITWTADYVAEADKAEKSLALAGHVRVTNHSGEDYENAQVRLVVGVIRLVEDIAQLARQARTGLEQAGTRVNLASSFRLMEDTKDAFRSAELRSAGKPKQIIKEGLSEYFLYTVEGRDTIPNGWSKRLPSLKAADVPVTSYYKFEREQWGDRVIRYYRFTNSVPSQLGKEPLPDGQVQAFRVIGDGRRYGFVGRTAVKYIPVGETVEMELGENQQVMVKPTLLDWAKTNVQFDQNGNVKGWTTKESWGIEVQNSKDIDAVVDIRRSFRGDWSLATDASYEKVDARKVKFVASLKPYQTREFRYVVTTNYGSNVAR